MILLPITFENTVSLFHYYIEDRTCSDWQYVVDDLYDKISKKAVEIENTVFKDKFNDIWTNMENFEVFEKFCVQLMAHGEHICEYTHVYGFLNRKL